MALRCAGQKNGLRAELNLGRHSERRSALKNRVHHEQSTFIPLPSEEFPSNLWYWGMHLTPDDPISCGRTAAPVARVGDHLASVVGTMGYGSLRPVAGRWRLNRNLKRNALETPPACASSPLQPRY